MAETTEAAALPTEPTRTEPTTPAASPETRKPPEPHLATAAATHEISNVYYQTIHADAANFGTASNPDQPPTTEKRSGTLPRIYITETLRTYTPTGAETRASKQLNEHRYVVLAGTAGSGRHCGAIKLLDDAAHTSHIVMLTPGLTLTELGKRTYTTGAAYIAPDIDTSGEPELDTVSAFLTGALADADAHLVATRTMPSTRAAGSGRSDHVDWTAPDTAAVVTAHITDDHLRHDILDRLEQHPVATSQRSLSTALKTIADGGDVQTALNALFRAEVAEVSDWFDAAPQPALVADLVVTLLLGPLPRPDWERHRHNLDRALAITTPATEEAPARPLLTQERLDRQREHRLLTFTRTRTGGEVTVDFAKPGYRAAVASEFHERYDYRVWRELQRWLETELTTSRMPPHTVVATAHALALLASESTYEVCERFLRPWSETEPNGPLQRVTVYTLWAMCADDRTANAALAFCRRWLSQGTANQVWSSALGFGGEVGRAFPAEATRQLWNLFRSDKPARIYAASALPQLFLVLEHARSSSIQVIRQLSSAVEATNHPGRDQQFRLRVLETTVTVLAARWNADDPPASFTLFRRSPDAQTPVADLWAAVLLNRRVRHEAVTALVSGLRALEQDAEASSFADLLGQAIFRDMAPESVAAITAECRTAARRRARPNGDRTDNVEHLINALSHDRTLESPDDGPR